MPGPVPDMTEITLIQPDVHLFDDARVLLGIRARELGEPLRLATDRLGRRLEQRIARRLVGERLVAFGIEPRDDGRRRAERRERRKPRLKRHTLIASFTERR